MIPNPNKMLKAEMLDRMNFRCAHYHNGFGHPACYDEARGLRPLIGILDIETSNLKADFGIILSWCIKDFGGDIYCDAIKPADLRKDLLDKRVTASCVKRLVLYDRVVTQYGTYFDLPFTRTRAEYWNIDYPAFGEILHTDVWAIAKKKLKLHSNRQGSIAETILHQDIKTRIHPQKWLEIQFGSVGKRKAAVEYVLDHNKKDVIQLEKIYKRLRKYVREGRTSI